MNNARVLLLTAFLFLFFALLSAKLFDIQVNNHDYYTQRADRQQNKTIADKAERGIIKDRAGEVLSYTVDHVSFFVDKRMLNDINKNKILTKFSEVFKRDKDYYNKLIQNGSNNICLERKASKEKALLLKEFVVEGLFKEEDFTRVYPYGSLASHLIGYVDNNCSGVSGIEKYYEEYLTGEDGLLFIERDVVGRMISVDEESSMRAAQGNTVHLTIDKTYQTILEEELVAGLKKHKAESAVGIIMNPNNGEILALSNLPDFDPGNYSKFAAENRRNRAVTDTYEPGSTMKAVTMAMLLEEGVVNENEIINTENGKFKIRNVNIVDSHKFASLNVKEVFEQSSNIGMAKLSDRLSPNKFYKYLRDFGFGNESSVDLPGEVPGYLKRPEKYSRISKPFMSYGYEIATTPLQMVAAYSALINGGTLLQPHIVKKITDNFGNVVEEFSRTKIRNVISESTSAKLKEFMLGVVEEGTGQGAQLDNVLVGGKTGTSQKLINGNYSKEEYNSSFIGFLPVDNPQIVCLILFHSPRNGKYGGEVAAPVFKRVAQKLVEADLNIVPNESKIERVRGHFDKLVDVIKSGEDGDSYSDPAARSKRNLDEKNKLENIGTRSTMPNLKNLSFREAASTLTELGLNYERSGYGKVVWQSINPGDKIKRGDVCTLKCDSDGKLNSLNLN